MKEKAGEIAGRIWTTLNENGGMTLKEIKKAAKLNEKDFFLGLGWLLREDKIETSEADAETIFSLK